MPRIRWGISLGIACAGLLAQGAWAACYVVYGPDRQIAYRAQVPPVDMSRQLHETLPLVAPGGTMVFNPSSDGCELTVNRLPLKTSASTRAAPVRKARTRRARRS
ncbi:MAG: hypothetical protein OZ923_05045 [Comamonadaceae bacterium]|nr:hypothetical protein [Burkholderiales bacterium]MEB2347958.1 hypothetical protein [Comamonadaceae bacterium]